MFAGILIGICIGVLWGFGWAYFKVISPLVDDNEELKKGIHDCIKSGLIDNNNE